MASRTEDSLGAFCTHSRSRLPGSGEGPLEGRTFAVKDVFHIAGYRTGFGSPEWLKTHGPATVTASAVQRLLDAGARMVGKTLTDELAYSLTGENVHYGTPVNPAAPDRVPGGSSNGSASAVAGGAADFALGTDCGGSVRLPASYCGIFGIRPTVDRVPLDGVIPFGPPFDVAGWFARDADLLETVGRVLLDEAGSPPAPRRLLRGVDAFDAVEDRIAEALEGAVAWVEDAVGPATDVALADGGLSHWFETFRIVQGASIWSNLGGWVTATRPRLGPGAKMRLDWAAGLDERAVAAAKAEHAAIRQRIESVLGEGDVLAIPTSPRAAPLKNTPIDDIEIRFRNQAMHLLCIAGLGGLPQISLPMAEIDGLPLGLSLVGPRGADMQLLALARKLSARSQGETRCPTNSRFPNT
ncbi:MAG: amidase [Defluviicoccus sp.]|nr:amidase [Defluviicoccus sp.]